MQKVDIVIYQGDDTHFMGQTNRWYLPNQNYASYKARYGIGCIVRDAAIKSETDENGEVCHFVEFVLSSTDTAVLEPGIYTAALKLYDGEKRCQTVAETTVKILPQEVNNNGIC